MPRPSASTGGHYYWVLHVQLCAPCIDKLAAAEPCAGSIGFDQGAPSHGTALVTGSLGSSAAIWSHLVPGGQHWCTRQSPPSWIRCLLPSSCRSRTRPHIQGWGAGEAPGNNWTPSWLCPLPSLIEAGHPLFRALCIITAKQCCPPLNELSLPPPSGAASACSVQDTE